MQRCSELLSGTWTAKKEKGIRTRPILLTIGVDQCSVEVYKKIKIKKIPLKIYQETS